MEQVDNRDQPVAERRTDGRTHDIQRRIADEKIVAEHFDNRACEHRDKRQVNAAERLQRRVGDSHKGRRRYGKAENTHQHTAKLRALRVQHAQDRSGEHDEARAGRQGDDNRHAQRGTQCFGNLGMVARCACACDGRQHADRQCGDERLRQVEEVDGLTGVNAVGGHCFSCRHADRRTLQTRRNQRHVDQVGQAHNR